MGADEWLTSNGRKPWQLAHNETRQGDPAEAFWYWGTMADYDPNDPRNAPDEIDFLLPEPVFQRLQERTTYPNCKMYWTKDEAMEDFRQAYNKAVADGFSL